MLFLMPWLVGLILLKLVPILATLGLSFTNFYMLAPERTRFIGLTNYLRLLSDPSAGASLFGSLAYFLLTVPLGMVLALILAVIFASPRLAGKRILRTLFFMPAIIPATSLFFIWLGLTDPGSGWIQRLIIKPLGLPPMPGAFTPGFFNMLLYMITVWSIGPGFLIMLGAIQGVPKELYESARVDGAGPLARLINVTLPMISPAIFFTLVINLTSAFGGAVLLDRGFFLNQGLSPMENYIYYEMFSLGDMGYASALTWLMFAVVMSITIALFRSARRWVYFPEEREHDEI